MKPIGRIVLVFAVVSLSRRMYRRHRHARPGPVRCSDASASRWLGRPGSDARPVRDPICVSGSERLTPGQPIAKPVAWPGRDHDRACLLLYERGL